MNEGAVFGRLVNGEGELMAEGPCYVDEAAGQATLEPERAPGILHKERGPLTLQLDSGRSYNVSNPPMIIDYRAPGGDANENGRRRVFRLRISPIGPPEVAGNGRAAGGAMHEAQDARAAGAAGEGASAALPLEGRPPASGGDAGRTLAF